MNYAAVKKTDVANGPGIRVSLFVSGCTHRCRGCFNSEAWDFGYGQPYTSRTEQEILQALAPDYIRGLSILGGEPMEPLNRGTVLGLLRTVRRRYPEKDIWCYTGYDYERDILKWKAEQENPVRNFEQGGKRETVHGGSQAAEPVDGAAGAAANEAEHGDKAMESPQGKDPETAASETGELLSLIDVLVDGEFVEERRNLRLAFRGSENQRLIDVKASLRQGETVCLREDTFS